MGGMERLRPLGGGPMNAAERSLTVYLTNGEVLKPDIVKTKDSGWLYCCWTGGDAAGGVQRTYPPHRVDHYNSAPVGGDAEVLGL